MDGADSTRSRARQGSSDRKAARLLDRHEAAGGLVDAKSRLRRNLGDALGKVPQIAGQYWLQIGVQHRRRQPLIFTKLRLNLRGNRQVHVGKGGREAVADHPFVVRIEEREQKADRAGIRLRRRDLRHETGDGRRLEGAQWLALGGHAFWRFEPQFARHEGHRIVRLEVEDARPYLATDLDQVAKALGDDERHLAAAPLDQCIGGNGRAVRQARHAGQIDGVQA